MKKTLLALISLMLCAMLALSGCKELSLDVYLDYQADKSLTTATQLTDLTGFNKSSLSASTTSRLTVLENAADTKIYNNETGTIVFSATNTPEAIYNVDAVYSDFFVVTVIGTSSTKTSLYKKTGEVVVTANRSITSSAVLDFVAFDGKYYEYVGDTVATYDSINATIPTGTRKHKSASGYTYYDATENEIFSYDRALNLLYTYQLPSFASGVEILCFDNGNYIVQYSIATDIMDNNFTYMTSGMTKYDYATYFVNIADDKVKELDCDYVFSSAVYYTVEELETIYPTLTFGDEGLKEDLALIVTSGASTVENQHLNKVRNTAIMINLDAKISEAPSIVKNQDTTVLPEKLSNGNVMVTNSGNQKVLVDGEGNIIKAFNKSAIVMGNYIYENSKLYNLELAEVAIPEGYEVLGVSNKDLILAKANTTTGLFDLYTLNGGTPTLFASGTNATINGNYILVAGIDSVTTLPVYAYYSADGKALVGNLANELTIINYNQKACVYLMKDATTGNFYKFS